MKRKTIGRFENDEKVSNCLILVTTTQYDNIGNVIFEEKWNRPTSIKKGLFGRKSTTIKI